MTVAERVETQVLDWAIAGRALAGQPVSGDLHFVQSFEGGALVALIDGLGHGPEAAQAARAAVDVLSRRPGASVLELIQLCHQALRPTRGVAMSLASFDARTNVMSWVGVGDVEGALTTVSGARESILLRNGVVGYQLPGLRGAAFPVTAGDTLILATDGVRRDFAATAPCGRRPQEVANDIVSQHGKSTDDALVLVVRYLGMTP